MISNLKRYGKTVKAIESNLKMKGRFDYFYVYFTDLVGIKITDDRLSTIVGVYVDLKNRLRVVEEKGNIYIGYDLNKVESMSLDGVDKFREDLAVNIVEGFYNNNYGLADGEKDRLDNKLQVSRDTMESTWFNRRLDIIKRSEGFKEICEEYEKRIYSADVVFWLRDKDWPSLRDRKILPIVVINCNKGGVSITNSPGNNYKRGNFECSLSDLFTNYEQILTSDIYLRTDLTAHEVRGRGIR